MIDGSGYPMPTRDNGPPEALRSRAYCHARKQARAAQRKGIAMARQGDAPTRLVEQIDAALRTRGSPGRAEHERAYLKSQLEHYGTSVPAIRSVAKAVASRHPDLSHDDLLSLVDTLWAEPVHERRVAAVELLDIYHDRLCSQDVALLERLLRESRTWALVDPLAASVAGRLTEHHPELGLVLDRWAKDHDFWIRRAALLTLLVPLRRGEGDFERFAKYADAMLDDKEFFIRKAIGWVLRDTAKKRPDLVYTWLLPRAARASTVTIREAIKPLSESQRRAIVAVRSGGGLNP
jgi:3-methyladenine DNA glycosylase AlkD